MSFASPIGRRPMLADARRPLTVDATLAAVLVITVAGAVLRFADLGHQGLWYDESYTALLVSRSPGKMLGLIPHTESTPPLYYCLVWAWVRVFGRGAAGLRSLSAVAGVAVIPLAYAGAAELLQSRRAGVACAALAAFNPFLWWYSQEARSYELLCALAALSLWAFARARRDPSPGRVTSWVLASALAMGTHYFAAVLVVPEALVLIAGAPRRRAVQAGVVVVALCGAALVPLAVSQNGTGNDGWIGRSPLGLRLAQIVPQLLIGTGAPDRVAVKFAAFALGALALGRLPWAAPQARRGALLAGGLALAGFAITLVLIPFGFDDVITRNLIELWVPLAVCAAGGLAAVRAPRAGNAVCAALCALGVFCIVGVLTEPRLQRPEWPALARVLGERPPAGQSRAILIQRYRTLLPLSRSLPGLHVLRGPARVSELDVIAMRSPGQPLCWWGAECNLVSSRLQRRYAIAGLRDSGGVRRISQFRVRELWVDRGGPVTLTRAELRRALHTTRLAGDVLMLQSSRTRAA